VRREAQGRVARSGSGTRRRSARCLDFFNNEPFRSGPHTQQKRAFGWPDTLPESWTAQEASMEQNTGSSSTSALKLYPRTSLPVLASYTALTLSKFYHILYTELSES
jgi:hypothetical protein